MTRGNDLLRPPAEAGKKDADTKAPAGK